MDKFYKLTINEGIRYAKQNLYGVANPTDKDFRSLGGSENLSTLYGFIGLCDKKSKKYKNIYICDPEGSIGSENCDTPDIEFEIKSQVVVKHFNFRTEIYISNYKVSWLDKYTQRSPSGSFIYGLNVGHNPMSSALCMYFYFE